MILCLSCVVVFCTVYALILPAITLERKTVCGQEEHSHTEECYSSDGQLACGKTEHTHTESCYADDKTSEDQSGEDSQQTPEQNQTEGPEQNQGQSQEQNQDQSQEQNKSQNQVQTSDDGNVAQNGENGDTAGTTADETSGNDEESVVAGSTSAPAAEGEDGTGSTTTATEGFDLSAAANKADLKGVVLQYYDATQKTWIDIQENVNNTIPGDAKIKLTVQYQNVSIEQLLTTYNCKMTYDIPELLRNMTAEGKIFDNNAEVGTVTAQEGKIVVAFKEEYLKDLQTKKHTVIAGNFYVEGDVKLSQLGGNGKATLTTADKNYTLDFGQDALAKYGKVTVDKQCVSKNKNVISRDDGNYLEYTITVTAGEDGCPDVSVVDTFTNNSSNVDFYAQITTTETVLAESENGVAPYETVTEGKKHGTIYKGNKTEDNIIPVVPTETKITEPGSMVWKIGEMAAGEVRTLTYFSFC